MKVKIWGEEFSGKYKPLVKLEKIEECKDILNPERKKSGLRFRFNPEFPLKDKMYCGFCNKRMTAANCQGRPKKYALYYCRNVNCSNPEKKSVSQTDIEQEFEDYLNKVRPKEKYLKKFRKIFLNRYYERQEEFITEEEKLRKYIGKLEKNKKQLIRLGRDCVLDDEDLKEELSEVKSELMDAKIKLNETHGEEFKIEYLLDYAENVIRTMDRFWFDADPSVKIKFQRLIFPE